MEFCFFIQLTHCQISTLVCQLQSRPGQPVFISNTQFRKPDFAFGGRSSPIPTLVGEVSYSHSFTRSELEAKYQVYLTKTNEKILTVMCVDLHYAGVGEKILQTARDLDRTATSVWILRDGVVETVMDWVPLS